MCHLDLDRDLNTEFMVLFVRDIRYSPVNSMENSIKDRSKIKKKKEIKEILL